MTSFHILRHSMRQVFGNSREALIVSAPILALQFVSIVAMFLAAPSRGAAIAADLLALPLLGLWVLAAIKWHRFVLLEEVPRLLAPWNAGRVLPYLGRGLQAGACGLVVMLPAILVSAFDPVGWASFAAILVAGFAALVVSMRLMPMFPAVALGRGFGPLVSLRHTRGSTLTMIALSLLMAALGMLLGVVGTIALQLALGLPSLGMLAAMAVIGVFQILGSTALIMIQLSIATTLYGVYVERRELI